VQHPLLLLLLLLKVHDVEVHDQHRSRYRKEHPADHVDVLHALIEQKPGAVVAKLLEDRRRDEDVVH
jgi:hypothetical protein